MQYVYKILCNNTVSFSSLFPQIVGSQFDSTEDTSGVSNSTFYETIYALLDKHSPKYRLTFGETLAGKLQSLEQVQNNEDTAGVQ